MHQGPDKNRRFCRKGHQKIVFMPSIRPLLFPEVLNEVLEDIYLSLPKCLNNISAHFCYLAAVRRFWPWDEENISKIGDLYGRIKTCYMIFLYIFFPKQSTVGVLSQSLAVPLNPVSGSCPLLVLLLSSWCRRLVLLLFSSRPSWWPLLVLLAVVLLLSSGRAVVFLLSSWCPSLVILLSSSFPFLILLVSSICAPGVLFLSAWFPSLVLVLLPLVLLVSFSCLLGVLPSLDFCSPIFVYPPNSLLLRFSYENYTSIDPKQLQNNSFRPILVTKCFLGAPYLHPNSKLLHQ